MKINELSIVEKFQEKVQKFRGWIKSVKKWLKRKTAQHSCFGDTDMVDVDPTPAPPKVVDVPTMRQNIVKELYRTIERMHGKAMKQYDIKGDCILHQEQMKDLAEKLEQELLNNLNNDLQQTPMSDVDATREYFLRANKYIVGLKNMKTFEVIVQAYRNMQP
jgi:ribosome-binding ATPase YchF (GTP1/OBG family)